MNGIRAIFFDAAGTLIRLPRGVGHHYSAVARRHGCALDAAVLDAAFRAAWKTMPARPATRTARPDDDRGWWRALVDSVLDRVGAAALDRDAYFAELYAEFARPGVWELFPEVREVLDALAGRCGLGIISNFDGRLRAILGGLGIAGRFEFMVLSSEVGADKPDPWIFERALSLAGVRPEQALHVGDDPRCDWAGAAAAGLRVFHLERPRGDLRGIIAKLTPRPCAT